MQRLRILQDVLSQLPLTPPLDSYWVSSYFGKRRDPYNGRWAMHEGIDLAGQAGLKIRAGAPGRIVTAGWKGGYGQVVEIDHGYGITTLYGHLKSVTVNEGDQVKHRGEIGRLGNTGRSTGPHVHYEIQVDGKPVDPMNFLKAGRYVFKK
jgi:murein DD-endopeptidase MepM/ murein hydrolase activator NlpD